MADTATVESFRIGGTALLTAPFPHFHVQRCLSRALEESLLAWFESEAPWSLVEADFYEQHEFSLLDVDLPPALAELFSEDSPARIRDEVGSAFGVPLGSWMTVVAHRLTCGQRIAIHNDYLEDGETHRLTVQLNRGLTDDDGGLFLLFNSADPADVNVILRPISASGLGFEIGPSSFHAVSRQHTGERYTVVFSFRAER